MQVKTKLLDLKKKGAQKNVKGYHKLLDLVEGENVKD